MSGFGAMTTMRGALRAILAGAMIVALSACLGEGTGGDAFGFLTDKRVGQTAGGVRAAPRAPKKAPLQRAELAGGAVVVQGPRGYCVDPATLRRGLGGGFALIAACNSLSGQFTGADVEPVVMTVQVQAAVGRKDAPDAAAMAAALAPIPVLERIDGDGLSLLHLGAGGDAGLPTGDPKYWRGAMMINGYLVGIAVYAPKGSRTAGPRGRRVILALAEQLRAASPARSHASVAKVAPATTE